MRSGIFVEKHAEKVIKLQKNSIICYGKENARQFQILLYQNCPAKRESHARLLDFSCTGDIVSPAKNPKTQKRTLLRTVLKWLQTQFLIRVALGCKVALKCNRRSVCNPKEKGGVYSTPTSISVPFLNRNVILLSL